MIESPENIIIELKTAAWIVIELKTAAWIGLAVVSILSILFMRLSVRFLGKGADNGWDNALAYTITSGLLYFGLAYLVRQSLMVAAFAPLVSWTAQTFAIKFIYQVRIARAWLIGLLHGFITSAVVTALGLSVAFVAAYILYGKIISDPMFLIRLLLRLIGIEI